MKTQKAAVTAKKSARKGTSKKATIKASRKASKRTIATIMIEDEQGNPVHPLELPVKVLDAMKEDAKKHGISLDAMFERVMEQALAERLKPMRSIVLNIPQVAFEGISKKALREKLTATQYLESFLDVFGQWNDVVPLLLPFRTVQRLAEAGEAADLEDTYHGIATAVLGDLADDPEELAQWVTDAFGLPRKDEAALKRLTKRWAQEDAKARGEAFVPFAEVLADNIANKLTMRKGGLSK